MPTPSLLLVAGMPQVNLTITPSMGLYKLAHYVRERGASCEVFEPNLDDEAPLLERVRSGAYDVIGLGCSHWNMQDDLARLARLRAAAAGRRVLFIGGGVEASLNPEPWLDNGMDAIFLGYAEHSLARFTHELRRRLTQDQPWTLEDLVPMPGLVYRAATGELVKTPAEPMTQAHFEELSYRQALTLEVPYERYWSALRARSADTSLGSSFVFEYVRLFTTSHCARRCGFCSSQTFLRESQGCPPAVFMLSAEQIAELVLLHVRRDGARGFALSDDDFPIGTRAGIERVLDLSRRLVALKAEGQVPADVHFACQARVADFLDPTRGARAPHRALMRAMAAAGFRSIALGVETFAERVLRAPSINKLGVTSADCHTVISAMLEEGLVPLMNLIIGIPEYTPAELEATLVTAARFVEAGCEINVTGPLYAAPGAPLYGREGYPIRWTEVEGLHGRRVRMSHSFIPLDPLVRQVSEQYEERFEAELSRFAHERGWEGKILHKRARNLVALLTVAELLENARLVTDLRALLERLVSGELRIAV